MALPSRPEVEQVRQGRVERALRAHEVSDFIRDVVEENREAAAKALVQGFDAVEKLGFMHRATATLAFKDVAYSINVPNEDAAARKKGQRTVNKVILEPVSGVVRPGELVAVMGPSGCGKSTLVEILAGKKTSPYSGDVFLNGRPRDRLYDLVTAFVPQDDAMPERWTVREAVTFNFILRRPLPKVFGKNSAAPVVDMILESLGLEGVASTAVGGLTVRGISGGQRRRVTLARGLATGASIIFCDEPTSGLSSTDAETVVRRLKLVSVLLGTSFVVVIHQPKSSVFQLFDGLILLAASPGRCVYNGPLGNNAALDHFARLGCPVPAFANPADHFIDCVSPGSFDHSTELAAYYQAEVADSTTLRVVHEIENPGLTAEEVVEEYCAALETLFGPLDMPAATRRGEQAFAAPLWRQVAQVFGREIALQVVRSKNLIAAKVVTAALKGLILGIAFLDIASEVPISQVAFIFLLAQMEVIGLLSGMEASIAGRTIMRHEVDDGLYRQEVFVVAVTLVDLVLFLVTNACYFIVAFALSGLPWRYFGVTYGWALLCLLVIQSYYQACAAAGRTTSDATTKALPLTLLFLLFNGFFVTKATVVPWMEWAIYVSPLFYFIQEVAVALFSDGTSKDDPNYLASGQYVLDYYEFEDGWAGIAAAVLVGETVLFRALQLVFLKHLNKLNR